MDGLKEKKYVHTRRKRFDPFAMVCGIGLILYIISSLSSGGNWRSFWDVRSLFVVFGGTLASLLIQYDFFSCLVCLKDILQTFLSRPEKKMLEVLKQLDDAIINDLSILELREGQQINGEILNDLVCMIRNDLSFEEIDGFITAKVRDILAARSTSTLILQRAAVLAPALGLFGTVIGLVNLLKSLNDPSLIGPAMSLALLTTAYGAGLSSLVLSPLAGRLEHSNKILLDSWQQLLNKTAILMKRHEKTIQPDATGKVA